MDHPTRWRAVLDLLAAHRELSALEWMEFKRSIVLAAICVGLAASLALTGWLAVNVAVVVLLRADPLRAVLALAGGNLAAAMLAIWQATRLLGQPFFAQTKREAGADARNLLRVLS